MAHWLIEASYFPMLITMTLMETFIAPGSDLFIRSDPGSTYAVVFASKGILFAPMRYVEIYPLSTLNDYRIERFYILCNTSLLH